jgi:hypothetical protein
VTCNVCEGTVRETMIASGTPPSLRACELAVPGKQDGCPTPERACSWTITARVTSASS